MKTLATCATLIVFLIYVPGCSQKQSIVGTWKVRDDAYMQFGADGSFKSLGKAASRVAGTYRFVDRTTVKIELTNGPSWQLKVAVSGDNMTITANGLITFTRVDPSTIKPDVPYEQELQQQLDAWIGPKTNAGATLKK